MHTELNLILSTSGPYFRLSKRCRTLNSYQLKVNPFGQPSHYAVCQYALDSLYYLANLLQLH
jgi:hypothetical protein